MPAALHRELVARAKKKFPGDEERQRRYVWDTLQRLKKGGK